MKVILATNEQAAQLEGVYKNESELRFVLDGNGMTIVGLGVLDDPDFEEIREALLELPQIDYVLPIES